ncbi:hypothetical protein P9H20_10940 [Lederbergia lenta]|nr:hypothetical protein [Lederbergia lenta]MCM3109406.1 hypothetical protein [Lederbergia lenta]MEC2324829.1 hypothetical protein [Lederbergia lenta]
MHLHFIRLSKTNKLVLIAYFSCLAAIFQSAGGLFPGIGYLISPLATAPLLLCTALSLPFGLLSYMLTMLLLLIIQPSELIVFPFTTGLLGFGIGISFCFFKRRLNIILGSTMILTLGITTLLYIIKFPVLGPTVSTSFSFFTGGAIILFSLFYSWLWVELSIVCFGRLKSIIIS